MLNSLVSCSPSWTLVCLLQALCDEFSAVLPLCLKVEGGVEVVARVSVSLSYVSNGDKEEVDSAVVKII